MGEHDQDAATPPEDVDKDNKDDKDEEKLVVEGEDDDAPDEGEASESAARTRIAFTG